MVGYRKQTFFKGGLIYLLLYFNSLNSCNVLALAVSLVLCGTAACPCLALSNTSISLLQNKHIYHLITNYFVFVYFKLKEYTWKTYKVLQHKRDTLFFKLKWICIFIQKKFKFHFFTNIILRLTIYLNTLLVTGICLSYVHST